MQQLLLNTILPLLVAATPVSLIVINGFSKLFSKYDPKLGNTTTICTSVTGSLTKDSLAVRTIFFDKYKTTIEDDRNFLKLENTDNKDENILIEKAKLREEQVLRWLAEITVLCEFKKIKKIEEIITSLFTKFGISKNKIQKDYEIIDRIPAPKEKKSSTTIVSRKQTKEIFAFTKGNPYHILKKCTKTYKDGKKIELTYHSRRKIRDKIKRLNKNGQKAIGFAIKPLPIKRQNNYTEQFAEREMTFVGIIGITSPINTESLAGIEAVKRAGIKIYITTSTKERKAVAIGKVLGLVNPGYFEAVTGEYLRKLSDQKIAKMLANKEKSHVFAELNAQDKERLVKIMKKEGETVAVAKNLEETIKGIKKGRARNKNRRKFYQHAISAKIAKITVLLIALIARAPLPLTITLILALDLSINLILELALRSDPVDEKVMIAKHHPLQTKRREKKALGHVILSSMTIGFLVSTIYIWSLVKNGWVSGETIQHNEAIYLSASTITFVLLAIIQIINAFNLKSPTKSMLTKNVLKNPYLILTSIIAILFLYVYTNFPAVSGFLNLHSVSGIEWQIILFSALIFIIIEEFRKWLLRKARQ